MTTTPMAQGRRCALLFLVGGAAILAAACATPVGAVGVEPDVVHRTLTGSVLSVGTPSIPTQNVLHEQNLAERFDEEPEAALVDLHAAVVSGRRGVSALFALSELSFFHAEGTGPIEDGDDGVVKYSSAHIEGVESELVIRSGHSVQGHPLAVDEVRRVTGSKNGFDRTKVLLDRTRTPVIIRRGDVIVTAPRKESRPCDVDHAG